MKNYLALALLALPLAGICAVPTGTPDLPRADVEIIQSFDALPATQHNRVCGYLLTGMAIAGQQQHMKHPENAGAVSERALATALAAILHINKDPKADAARKAAARALSVEIESLPAQDHVAIVAGCGIEAKEWVAKGEFTQIQLDPAIEIAEKQLRMVSEGARP